MSLLVRMKADRVRVLDLAHEACDPRWSVLRITHERFCQPSKNRVATISQRKVHELGEEKKHTYSFESHDIFHIRLLQDTYPNVVYPDYSVNICKRRHFVEDERWWRASLRSKQAIGSRINDFVLSFGFWSSRGLLNAQDIPPTYLRQTLNTGSLERESELKGILPAWNETASITEWTLKAFESCSSPVHVLYSR